jgi:hypothetical protein
VKGEEKMLSQERKNANLATQEKPRILVNDKRYFIPDEIRGGVLRAYAVYLPPVGKKAKA